MSKPSVEELAMQAVRKYCREQGVGNSLRGHDPYGEPEGVVTNPNDLQGLHASTDILVRDMADLLVRRFPGFRWAVQPSEFGKVFNVFNLDFSPKWGYRLKYTDIMYDPDRRAIVKAGHELLRRFGYPSTVFRSDLMAGIKRNADGDAIPDVSDMKRTRFTERVMLEKALADGTAKVVGTSGGMQVVEVRNK